MNFVTIDLSIRIFSFFNMLTYPNLNLVIKKVFKKLPFVFFVSTFSFSFQFYELIMNKATALLYMSS